VVAIRSSHGTSTKRTPTLNFLSSGEVTRLLLAIAVVVGAARLLGELARRGNQPAVLGELLAGVLLGPTVLGRIAPGSAAYLFPVAGTTADILNGFANVALVLFVLAAGLEIELSAVWRQGRAAVLVTVLGVLVPFGVGAGTGMAWPDWLGASPGVDAHVFALFLGTSLSISALPVVVKTLMDLNLLRTDLGLLVVATAVAQDLLGWLAFAVVLSLMGAGAADPSLSLTLGCALTFAVGILTVGRWLLHRALPWLEAIAAGPESMLAFIATAALLCGAFTEWIGTHAVFGAFLFGVAIGDSRHLRQSTRAALERFVASIFAPLFFASIGLRVDFVAHFDLALALVLTGVATVGKVGGGWLGARLGRLQSREAWAVGFAINSRGAMQLVLGVLALKLGLVGDRLFVALVVMSLATSMAAGPLMQRALKLRVRRHFTSHLDARCFVADLEGTTADAAIVELSRAVAQAHGLDSTAIAEAVLEREHTMATGLAAGVAVPHARMPGLTRPIIALGISHAGVDFGGLDGQPATIVVLTLTPVADDQAQLEFLADISRTLRSESVRTRLLAARQLVEVRAALKETDAAQG